MTDFAESTPHTCRLPPLQALCPWEPKSNPHHDVVSRVSDKWILGLNVLDGSKLTSLKKGGFSLLASLTWPYAGPEALRICSDYLYAVFAVDEITDTKDSTSARATSLALLRALKDGNYADGSAAGQMMTEFGERFRTLNSPQMFSQLVERFSHFFEGVIEEARIRENNEILGTVEEYMRLRRANAGVFLTWCMIPCALGEELPQAVYADPGFQEMELLASDMVSWTNDLYSYAKENAAGHFANNIVSVLQHAEDLNLQQALDRVGQHFSELVDKFEAKKKLLPSFGEDVDRTVIGYLEGMQAWVAGNIEWSMKTPRYSVETGRHAQGTLTAKPSHSNASSVAVLREICWGASL